MKTSDRILEAISGVSIMILTYREIITVDTCVISLTLLIINYSINKTK